MDDLQDNAKLRPIIDDGEGDIPLWNKMIARYLYVGIPRHPPPLPRRLTSDMVCSRGKDFMNAPWLFAEAYKYRRLHECFSLSKYWKTYDVFFRQSQLKSASSPGRLVKADHACAAQNATPSPGRAMPSSSCRSGSPSRGSRTAASHRRMPSRRSGSCSTSSLRSACGATRPTCRSSSTCVDFHVKRARGCCGSAT